MYRYAFFDLDDTLTDSSERIINSIKYALEKNGYPIPDETELLKFIGPPWQIPLQVISIFQKIRSRT